MQPVIDNIDNYSIGFSIDSIQKRYEKKEDFFNDVMSANPDIDKTRLKKTLGRVWTEAFPQKED